MLAIKGTFDGKRVVLPTTPDMPECPVIVVFGNAALPADPERTGWMRVQEETLAEAWDNDEDAVYDRL